MQTLDPSFTSALQFFLPAIGAALSMIAVEARKYMFTPLWDTEVFLKSNAIPLGINIAAAIVVYFMLIYVPFLTPILENLAGATLVVTSAGIFGFSQGLIKGFLQPKKTINDIEVNQ